MRAVAAARAVEVAAVFERADACLRRVLMRRSTSRSPMSSPVYSAIFLPFGKNCVAKQPLPSIGDCGRRFPGASFVLMF